MATKIQKWGNSQGLRLAKHVLEEANIAVGDDVAVIAREGVIIISPLRHIRGKYDLRELLAQIPGKYEAGEVDWGRPAGKEAW
jgi:antitoxin MazE